VINPVLAYPGILELLDVDTIKDSHLQEALRERIGDGL
jgi:hypothetical protein